jgi:superfamily II DNA helicase RecQ
LPLPRALTTFLYTIVVGKSLCYQLPAVVLGGTAVVISPLIALMQDQVQALNEKGVAAAVISSGNGDRVNREIMERLIGRTLLARPQNAKPANEKPLEHITILYVTPEQVQTNRFRDALVEIHKKKQLSLFAVDEAHWYVLACRCSMFALQVDIRTH